MQDGVGTIHDSHHCMVIAVANVVNAYTVLPYVPAITTNDLVFDQSRSDGGEHCRLDRIRQPHPSDVLQEHLVSGLICMGWLQASQVLHIRVQGSQRLQKC